MYESEKDEAKKNDYVIIKQQHLRNAEEKHFPKEKDKTEKKKFIIGFLFCFLLFLFIEKKGQGRQEN